MIQTDPRQWIQEINEVIEEYDLLSNQLSNAILNDSQLTIKQLQRFEVWEDKARQIKITAPNFFSFLEDRSSDRAKGAYEDLKFQLSQTLSRLRSEEFAKIESKKHEFKIRVFRNLNRLLWTVIKSKQFQTEHFYNRYLSNETEPPSKKKTVEFQEFFEGLDIPIINEIQVQFKDSADKDLAMLIYRLTELKLVVISQHSKTKSQKHFVSALIGEIKKDMSYIDRVLRNDIRDNSGKIHDTNYAMVKHKLESILNQNSAIVH